VNILIRQLDVKYYECIINNCVQCFEEQITPETIQNKLLSCFVLVKNL